MMAERYRIPRMRLVPCYYRYRQTSDDRTSLLAEETDPRDPGPLYRYYVRTVL